MRRIFLGLVGFLLLAGPLMAQDSIKEAEQLDFAQGMLSRGMYDLAIAQYQKFITDYPKSPSLPDAYLSLGEGYFLAQNFQKAMDTFNQFNQLFPASDKRPVSVLRLSQIDIEQQKYDEALKQLTSIDQAQLKGALLEAFDFYTAQIYQYKGDTAGALAFFQKAADTPDASDYKVEALEEMGQIQVQNKNFSQALDAYNKALTAAADDQKPRLSYRMAETQFLAGKYNEAIKGFIGFMGQYPDNELSKNALANLLLAYFNLGQYDGLLKVYNENSKKIKNDNTYFSVHLAAAMALIELKQDDKANLLLDQILGFSDLKPQQRARIFIKKADIFIREKKFTDALALLDAYSSVDTENTDETLFLKGECYFGMNQYDRAFNAFENVYLNFPDSRFAKASLLGQAHTRQATGRFKESGLLFSKYYAQQDQPDLKSEALYDEIVMAEKADEIEKAIASAQEYLKSYPNGAQAADVLLMLADSYSKNNQPQEAVKLLQGYLNSNQPPAKSNAANFLLGLNQQLAGNKDQALAAYKLVDPKADNGKFYEAAVKNMAILYLSEKDFDKAMGYFDQLITQVKDNDLQVKTYAWVCNEYLKKQHYEDVLRIAAEAEKRFGAQDLIAIKYFQAEALRGLNRCADAAKDYEAIISWPQKDVYTGSGHIGYGMCLEKDQKFDEAKAQFQKALDENAEDYTITAHARFETANADFEQGNLEEALKFYLLVATIYDNEHFCSESLLKAAQISERLKKPADAAKFYSEILEKYKDSPAAEYARGRMGHLK